MTEPILVTIDTAASLLSLSRDQKHGPNRDAHRQEYQRPTKPKIDGSASAHVTLPAAAENRIAAPTRSVIQSR